MINAKTYGHLLSQVKLDDNDDILDSFNKNSLTENKWLVESAIKDIPVGFTFQIMRKKYCYVDAIDNDNDIVVHIIPS